MGLPHGLWCPPPEPPVPKGTGTPLHLRAGPAGPVQAGSTCSGPQLCTPCYSLTRSHHGREEQRPAQPSARRGHGEERPEPVPQGALGRPCPQTFRGVSICRSISRFAARAGPGLTFINAPAPPRSSRPASLHLTHITQQALQAQQKKWWGPKASKGFPGGSGSRVCLQCGRPEFDPWLRKIPWRRARQPTPAFLSGEAHGQRSLAGYSPWGSKESDMD